MCFSKGKGLSFLDSSFRLRAVKDGRKKNDRTNTCGKRWRLGDVVDLEVLLEILPSSVWKRVWQAGVKDEVEDRAPKSEKQRRRFGFLGMLGKVRDEREDQGEPVELAVGARLESGLRATEMMMVVVMFLLGIALVRGLLTTFHFVEVDASGGAHVMEERGFNVWVFLAITLGVQWLILISATLGYVFWRKWSGGLSFFQGILSGSLKSWMRRSLKKYATSQTAGVDGASSAGRGDSRMWKHVLSGVGGEVWSWRLTRMLQSGSIGYNLGMMVGLFGCLWFLNVGYFWETSLPQFGGQSLHRVTQVLSTPVGGGLVSENDIALTQAGSSVSRVLVENAGRVEGGQSLTPRMQAHLAWSLFFFVSLAVWGLLPRVFIWLSAWRMERRSLEVMDFQESRHRSLWRELNRVQRGEVTTAPADGVVVLDIGGLEVKTETVRPYFLQVLRANPEERFSLGTLDAEGEKKAMDAARAAALGVVFLVEGWNLSPKQMAIYHAKVRAAIGERHMIRYLVLDGRDEEFGQWSRFVDGLKDSETEVFRYA